MEEKKVGDIKENKNGQLMEIIAFNGYKDITIRFEDGTTLEHQNYKSFLKGNINHPDMKQNKGKKNKVKKEVQNTEPEVNRIGETITNLQGYKMTIKAYRNTHDIDIEFDDGTIASHRQYRAFKKGTVEKPFKSEINEDIKEAIKTIEKKVKEDKKAEMENKENTENNLITVEKIRKSDYVGEKNRANNGQMMTIIAYRTYHDIDIQFEDGTIIKNRTVGDFKKGEIANPNKAMKRGFLKEKRTDLVGAKGKNNQGYDMTIIAYRRSTDIDVQFDIDGAIAEHRQYSDFKRGQIRHPSMARTRKKEVGIDKAGKKNPSKLLLEDYKKKRKGETNKAANGQMMTIIKYRKVSDIDVQFEDGTIVKHKAYCSFQNGHILNPNKPTEKVYNKDTNKGKNKGTFCKNRFAMTKEQRAEVNKNMVEEKENIMDTASHFGESKLSLDEQKMVIIGWKNKDDITILFEDGTQVENQTYDEFIKGTIDNPTLAKKYVGKDGINRDGDKMVILIYRNKNDIKVIFEDKTVVDHQKYEDFINGNIQKPVYHLSTDINMSVWNKAESYLKNHKLSLTQFLNNAISLYCAKE